jgi:hypothetical protein
MVRIYHAEPRGRGPTPQTSPARRADRAGGVPGAARLCDRQSLRGHGRLRADQDHGGRGDAEPSRGDPAGRRPHRPGRFPRDGPGLQRSAVRPVL